MQKKKKLSLFKATLLNFSCEKLNSSALDWNSLDI